jgi:energy-coupling factor transporter ATP-binding protein EcfA2
MIGVWSIARTVAIVGVGSVVLALFWHMLRGDKQVYPDEYGQLPIPWRVLRKHPELALRTIQHHQETRIIAAKNPMPTHFNYSPKFAPAAEAPMLEQAAPAPEPVHKWVPQVVEHPAHLALLGDTGSGKSTLARVIEHARAATDKIVILDPHANLNNWCGLPTVGAGRNFAAIGAMIHMIHAEFQRRYDLPPGADLGEPLTVFIDEVPAIADEDKDLMPIIAKWLREGRKVGIRLCMLSQGGEVKTLGIEGQGSIRENFLFVRMGTFARNTAGIAPGEPYPAALVRGYRSDDPPVPLDTAGLTSLPLEVLPASVAWAPSVALLSGITTIPGLDSGAKAPENNSNTTSERVLELIDAGKSLRAVQIEVFGYAGGAAHDRLQAILKKAGRLPIPR